MTHNKIDVDRTIQNIFDKINNAPAFAYNITDINGFIAYCHKNRANLKKMAKFVGVDITYIKES